MSFRQMVMLALVLQRLMANWLLIMLIRLMVHNRNFIETIWYCPGGTREMGGILEAWPGAVKEDEEFQ